MRATFSLSATIMRSVSKPVEAQSILIFLRSAVGPHPHRLDDVKAAEAKLHLAVLYLAEVEDIAHELLQSQCVALHHLEQFAASALDAGVFEHHLHWVGDERERRAQFVADVGKEHQARVGELHHLLVEPLQLLVLLLQFSVGLGELLVEFGLDDISSENHGGGGDAYQEEHSEADEHHLLRIIVGEVLVDLVVERLQIARLPLRIARFHQRELGVGLGDDGCT